MSALRLAVLPGDGVGPEVVAAALDLLDAAVGASGHEVVRDVCTIGWAAIRAGHDALPDDTLVACRAADAILLGAVGDPAADALAPHARPVGGLLRLRRELGCRVNLRPIRVTDGLLPYSAARPEIAAGTDMVIVRELAGGLYYGEPRGHAADSARAWNTLEYGAEEVRRIAHDAFTLAAVRRGRVTSVDKANVLEVSRLWRAVVDEVAAEYRDVAVDHMLVDRAAFEIVARPTKFDVVLTSNLFGDILSDGAAALVGSLGPLGSASLGGETDLYEPVHGSAPDIAGTGAANPLGAVESVALMLEHTFGLSTDAIRLREAVDRALLAGHRTADLVSCDGADATAPLDTTAFTAAVRAELEPA